MIFGWRVGWGVAWWGFMDPGESIQNFLTFVIHGLIEHPQDAVIVRAEDDRGRMTFDLTLRHDDVGRIIGKRGHVISSVRSLADAAAEKHNMRCRVRLHSLDERGEATEVEDEQED